MRAAVVPSPTYAQEQQMTLISLVAGFSDLEMERGCEVAQNVLHVRESNVSDWTALTIRRARARDFRLKESFSEAPATGPADSISFFNHDVGASVGVNPYNSLIAWTFKDFEPAERANLRKVLAACIDAECNFAAAFADDASAPCAAIGMANIFETDKVAGYGFETAIGPKNAQLMDDPPPSPDITWTRHANGLIASIDSLHPTHQQLQAVVDAIGKALAPLIKPPHFGAARYLPLYATEHLELALQAAEAEPEKVAKIGHPILLPEVQRYRTLLDSGQ